MTENINIVNGSTNDSSAYTYRHYSLHDGQITAVSSKDSTKTFFVGVAHNDMLMNRLTGASAGKVLDFMKRAVNNRTIERDYFKLYCEMLMGNMTEEEFEHELDANEDLYVVSENYQPTEDDLRLALHLSEGIKDVNTSEDLSSLFSFDVLKTEKLLRD